MEIRSYRAVFELERRIYRIDRLRLNPGGVPVRGVIYFLALLGGCLLAGRLPVIGAIPWYVLDLALPSAGAGLLGIVRIDGRPFHVAARSLLRHRLGLEHGYGVRVAKARPTAFGHRGECWQPPTLLLLPDGSDGRLRRMRYTGPGAVLVTVAHTREELSARRLSARRLRGLARLGGRPADSPLLRLREVGAGERSNACRGESRDSSGEQNGTVIVLAGGVRIRVGER
jgi:hypothetical protein